MATVYRVQDADGHGPYDMDYFPMAEFSDDEYAFIQLMQGTCLGDRHPVPGQDGIPQYPGEGYVCGFTDLAGLHSWFTPGDLDGMARWGYLPTLISVPDRYVVHGQHQLMFDQTWADVVARFQPSELQPSL